MNLIQKMIKNKSLSEEDTKALIAQLLEFVHLVKCMRKAQIEKDEYDMGERKDIVISRGKQEWGAVYGEYYFVIKLGERL